MHDTLRYVAEMLSGFKPDLLHNVGLHVASKRPRRHSMRSRPKPGTAAAQQTPRPPYPRPAAVQNEYDRTTEIVPGVFLDPSAAVYIADRQGEVVTWNHEEIAEDPSGSTDRLARFQIEHKPEEYSDRVHVKVDGEFDVAIIRTDEGVVVDVYPKDGSETIASTFAFDSEAEAPDSDAPAPPRRPPASPASRSSRGSGTGRTATRRSPTTSTARSTRPTCGGSTAPGTASTRSASANTPRAPSPRMCTPALPAAATASHLELATSKYERENSMAKFDFELQRSPPRSRLRHRR